MSYIRAITISTVLLLQIADAQATTRLDSDFQRCASKALSERKQSAGVINVDNSGLTTNDLIHNASTKAATYRMQVTNSVSGEDMGSITCIISRTGELLSSYFDS